MHIWRNHLVAGCVDKAAFGKHGLLHIFYELYGAERTSIFTAALSRLFTAYLQVCVPVWGGGGGARLRVGCGVGVDAGAGAVCCVRETTW